MALGFKIADGYVDVHAKYDKGDLQKTAHSAAKDFGDEFGKDKEHDRAGREAGRRVGRGATAGLTEAVRKSCTKKYHETLERCVVGQRTKQLRIGGHIGGNVAQGVNDSVDRDPRWKRFSAKIKDVFSRGGAQSASAFGRGFIEAITFGQADIGPGVASRLKPQFAAAGSAVGAIFAGLLVAEIAAAITAAAPLLLGGLIAAIPLISLIKSGVKKEDGKWVFQANAMGEALKKLSKAWKEFKTVVSAPFQSPLITILDHAADALKRLQGPWAALVRSISPGIVALFDGVFGAIEAFVKAIAPAMPGVVAGLREWGVQLPIIGAALGKFFAAILANPGLVVAAIQNISRVIQDLLIALRIIIPVLTFVAVAWTRFGNAFRLGAQIPGLVVAAWKVFVAFFRQIPGAIGAALARLKQRWNEAVAGVRGFVNSVVAFLKTLPGKAAAAVSSLWSKMSGAFTKAATSARAKATDLVNRVVAFLKTLPGKAASAISALWSKMQGAFTKAASSALAKAKDLVSKVVAFLKTLPGKAKSAVSNLWSSMQGAFTSAVNNAKAKGKALVDGFINALKPIVSRAKAQVVAAKNAIVNYFSGAIGWLKSAGTAIMSGLAAGIRNGASAAVTAAVNAAKSALAAAKRALKITSPSQVFAEEVGKPIAEGIGIGMRKHVSEEFKELPGMLPTMGGRAGQGGGTTKSYSSTFSPNITIQVAAGLNGVDAAARRALTKELFLEIEAYRKDYVSR